MLNYSGYNIGCFTTPFVQSFLGPVGVVTTCLFDAGNSLLSTGGTYSLAASYLGKGRTNAGAFFKKIFSSVPFVTYLVMLALSILHLSVPAPVTVFTGTVGAANSFLAMLMIGLGLEWNMPKGKGIRIGKALLVRYSAAAILALLLFFCTPFSLEVRQVLALVAMSPIASLAVVFTEKCDGDIAMASTINSLSIMISVLIMTGMILAMGV